MAWRYRRRGRSRRGGAAGQGLRPDPGGAARTRWRAVQPGFAARAASRRTGPPHPCRARADRGGDLFIHLAREAELFGGAEPELQLVNPISTDLDAMRPSLLPGLIERRARNADRGFPDAALFELGPLYRDDTPAGQILAAAGRAQRTDRHKALALIGARRRSL